MRLRKRLYRRLKKVLRVHRAQRSWVDASPHQKPHVPPTPTLQPEPAPTQADPAPASDEPLSTKAQQTIREAVIDTLRMIYDPEIPVNIYELGLVYRVDVDESGAVEVDMTLTSPHCPVAQSLADEVARRTRGARGVKEAKVDIVWDPPWDPSKMSEAARLELNMI
ncbi:MAG: DUF59 domain-containing protein [Proteobacteria bacterium]|nr:DUF59 domain-containing protein [Pseudomonadota bacterium]